MIGLENDMRAQFFGPGWKLDYDIEGMLNEIYDRNVEHWTAAT